ncbi:hypothetical protein [Candidatus Clostridium stratigraminis]|uniref:Lipoprotein n=1 Tax=Candidatus Clostridium stratigraminis TaxID=3381661 RepID=A0ABW8T5N2_9CLOT
MINRISILIIIVILIFTGCAKVQSNKISIEAENTIKKISMNYGEANPEITLIEVTKKESTFKPMYIVSIIGNFQKGEQKAKKLQFSITKDGKEVWAFEPDGWKDPVK